MNKDKKQTNELINQEGADSMNATVERPCSIKESIIQSCKEVKLMQSGMLPKKTWKELCEERKGNKGAD